jgi:integrase
MGTFGKHQREKVVRSNPETRTVGEYLKYWLDNHAAPRCQPKTLERYRQLADNLTRLLGGVSLLDLRPAIIQDVINVMQVRGGAPTKAHPEGRPLAPKTVHATASVLSTCLGDAARLEHIPANPMGGRKVKVPKRPKPSPEMLDAAALGTVFQAAEGTRLYAFVVTAGCSGCRRGELLAITWADLSFATGLMRVSKSLEQTRAGLRVKCTKSGNARTISIDDFALDVLAAHKEKQQQDKIKFGSTYRDHNLVFCQPNGDFYSPDHMGTRTKVLLRKAGYPDFSLHSLRHSHASILLVNGTPIAVVSERLGHSDQNITLGVYSHCLPWDRKAASRVWHTVLVDIFSKDRVRKSAQHPLVS